MRAKAISRMLFVVGVITWLALLFTDLSVVFSAKNNLPQEVPVWLPGIIFNLYLLALYYYYKFKIEHNEQLNFVDLLWRVFATGLIATVISLLFKAFEELSGFTKPDSNFFSIAYVEVIYLINLGLLVGFLLAAFAAWKKLILYQKSKWLLRGWTFFEYCLLLALLYTCFDPKPNETLYYILLTFFIVLGLILSANMKWVAFLNFRQKWTSILLLLLVIFYLFYLAYATGSQADKVHDAIKVNFIDYGRHLYVQPVMIFVVVYSIFSFLVILFNLPTTSVFEQKLEEVVNFQRISQSIQTEQSEESVYNILLETSVSSVFADAAWLETKDMATHRVFTYHITEKEAYDIIAHLKNQNVTGVLDQGPDKTKNLSRHLAALRGSRFRSILAFPIYVKGENIGTLALLKELPDGFNKEMTKIVSTFANQAGISIENFRLMEEALQGERYKEELKIAKTVQKSLLPQVLEQDADFEIAAFSESADEVGGDYYDTLRINESETSLIIADVSGKGTTAAFHMSQMKGIFHSLAQDCIEPSEFMARANKALVYCLERGSFISAIFFMVDTRTKTVRYSRAGHCPVLYYSAAKDKAEYFKDKGVALGMVRNNSYKNFIEANQFTYAPGDIMVLYTDGITEAKNGKGDEFGYERLTAAIMEVKNQSPRQIQDHLISRLYEFSGTDNINDDYTTMIVRFNNRT